MRLYSPSPIAPYRVTLPSVKQQYADFARLRGMGDAASAANDLKYVQSGATIATPIITTIAAQGAAASLAAGGSGLILGMAPALAVPVIGAAIAAITVIATILIQNSGCGQTCIETSQWANQAEQILEQNIQAYFSNPAPRTQSVQNAALANFLAVMTRLDQMCSDPSTGDAGKRCISDRQAGACTWKQSATSVLLNYPGEPQPGECFNWVNGYHDPIANDPDVVQDPASNATLVSGATNSSSTSSTSSNMVYLLGAATLVVMAFGASN